MLLPAFWKLEETNLTSFCNKQEKAAINATTAYRKKIYDTLRNSWADLAAMSIGGVPTGKHRKVLEAVLASDCDEMYGRASLI